MKLTPREAKAENTPMEYKPPKYPSGLELRLDAKQLEALKIKGGMDVEQPVEIKAEGYISSYRYSERAEGEPDECLCIQITELEIKAPEEDEDERKEHERLARTGKLLSPTR